MPEKTSEALIDFNGFLVGKKKANSVVSLVVSSWAFWLSLNNPLIRPCLLGG